MARKDIELQEHLLFYGSLLLLIGLCLVEATVVATNINIALGKPTKQYPGTYCGNKHCHNSSLAVDGSTDPDVNSGSCSHTTDGANDNVAWWSVDFEGLYHLSSIQIYNRDSLKTRLKGFTIKGIPGGENIFQDKSWPYSSRSSENVIDINLTGILIDTEFSGINISISRHWHQETILTLCEVKVFPGDYNIARGKPTHQFPGTYCDSKNICHNSSLAVNGNTSPEVDKGHCSHTDDITTATHTGAWWTVDFEQLFFLSTIRIFNRDQPPKSTVRGRLKGFSVKGLPGNIEIYNDRGPSQYLLDTIDIAVSTVSRFSGINITIPDGRFLTLCEVQVFFSGYCRLPSLRNGRFSWRNGSRLPSVIPLGPSFIYSCDKGYTNSTQTNQFCDSIGSVNGAVSPECAAISCGPLNDVTAMHAVWVPVNSSTGYNCTHYKCAYIIVCNEGYRRSTLKRSTFSTLCDEHGKWTTMRGTCDAIECPTNTNINANYTVISQLIRYTYTLYWRASCNKGFKLLSGNLSRKCLANGTWSGKQPFCVVVVCTVPKPKVSVISEWKSPAVYQSVLESKCKDGFTKKHGDVTRKCEADGTWSGQSLDCEEIQCHSPENILYGSHVHTNTNANDTQISGHSDQLYPIHTTLKLKCNDGYDKVPNVNATIVCQKDGSWSRMLATCSEKLSAEAQSDNAAVIGGSVGAVVAIAIIAAVIVGFIIMRRRRSSPPKGYAKPMPAHDRSKTDDKNVYSTIEDSHKSYVPQKTQDSEYSYINESQGATGEQIELDVPLSEAPSHMPTEEEDKQEDYYNITSFDKKSPTAIMLDDLVEFVLTQKTTRTKLEEQFNKLPTGMIKPHKTALNPINAKKNRYKQIYAYDENRVILKHTADNTKGDYINASCIHGYDRARAYVASQGPTKDMINDFWDMVWQQDCGKIVMLTNLKEENKMKCIQYWPSTGTQSFGRVMVTLKGVETYSDFTIRTLAIKQASEKQRIVRQFHYTAWPDRGVPAFASSIVNFRNKVLKAQSYCKGPTVVHCSAGIGRTGTYIALDILTDQGNSLGYIDVAACVAALRQQRVNMVQNLDQYIFLHSALTDALMLSSSAISAPAFSETYQELLQVDPVKRRRNIEIKFEMLKHMSPVADEQQYVSAREVRNKKRNRYSNILPVSEFMPTIKGSKHDGYINAVYLPSYKEKNAMILTQMPLANTKDDFWALIQQHKVDTIVMLNNITEAEREEIYWPDVGESQTYNNHDVESLGEETVGQHSVVTLHLSDENTELTVKQIQCRYWPAHQSLPNSPSDIIETIELVQKLQQQSGNHPVVVHCMNGVDRSGLFCVISAVIERLKIEQDVAITQIIEQMRCCRDQIIPSCEQFQFCHDVVLTYIQQFTEYSNFSSL